MCKEYTCEICQRDYCNNENAKHLYTFYEEEFLLTKDEKKCIFHCKKKEDINVGNFFYKKLNNSSTKQVIYKDYHFPHTNGIDYFTNYFQDINDNIKFYNCTFNNPLTSFKNIALYQFCIFEKALYLGNRYNSEETYCFECTFKSTVYFSHNCEIDGDIFDNCTFLINPIKNNLSDILALDTIFNGKVFKNHKSNLPVVMFQKCIFNKELNLNEINHIEKLIFLQCDLNDRVFINNSKNINTLNIRYSTCAEKVEIKYCNNIQSLNLYNTKFKATIDLFGSTLNETNFEKTDFENVVVFENTVFKENVNFKFTTFTKLCIFKKATFKKSLNLEDSIIHGDMNFLKISAEKNKEKDIHVSNRETARVIKNCFEKLHNTIEANKYYALEMHAKNNELKWLSKDFFKKIIFFIHRWSSNYSQSWVLALCWIIVIGILNIDKITYNLLVDNVKSVHSIFNFFDLFSHLSNMFVKTINEVSKSLYELIKFNIDNITINTLFFKVALGYLIYQFIISIRQDTRRK